MDRSPPVDLLGRGRRSVAIDLKHPDGAGLVLALVDGAAALVEGFRPGGYGATNGAPTLLDSGAHVYEVYETADRRFVSVGSIEPRFYAELLRLTGLDGEKLPAQLDRSQWPVLKERLAAVFRTKSLDEWCSIMEGTDVCFAPVLSMAEAPEHPHNVARHTFVEVAGVVQPAPAPVGRRRLSAPTPSWATGRRARR